jgi:ribosomal protein L29
MADVKKTTKATTKLVKKASEVKTIEQLHDELAKLRVEHNESRKSHRAGELVNPHVLTAQRKSVAQLLTAINASNNPAVKEEN